MQLNWEMEGCPQGAHTPCGVSGHRAAWLHVGQDWAGTRVTGAGTAWRVSWLALVLGGTVGCCHPMGETSPRLLGGWCRRGQEQALGAGMWGVECPPRTRVPFTCAPTAAAARTPDGCPKAPARSPALGAPSCVAGALATLPSRDAGLGAAGAPRAWLRGTLCLASYGTQHPTRVPPHAGKGASREAVGCLGSEGVLAQPSCQPDGPPRASDLVRVAMETP